MCGIIPPVIGRCGGIGRRPGLKIPWEEIPVPVRPRPWAPGKWHETAVFEPLSFFVFFIFLKNLLFSNTFLTVF